MILTFLIAVAVWKLGQSRVWMLWVLSLLIDHDLPIVTSDNETLGVGLNALDVESLSWRLRDKHLVITI